MSLEIINIGSAPNDGEGDPLRTSFSKINNNFANLYATSFLTSNTFTVGTTAGQVIFETPVIGFTQGMFQIRSSDAGTSDSQSIILSAQITNNLTDIKFTGYGTTFSGNAVSGFDMDVSGSNVRVLANPILDSTLTHFISAQVTYIGASDPGLEIQLDGYLDGYVLTTENDEYLTTENA